MLQLQFDLAYVVLFVPTVVRPPVHCLCDRLIEATHSVSYHYAYWLDYVGWLVVCAVCCRGAFSAVHIHDANRIPGHAPAGYSQTGSTSALMSFSGTHSRSLAGLHFSFCVYVMDISC